MIPNFRHKVIEISQEISKIQESCNGDLSKLSPRDKSRLNYYKLRLEHYETTVELIESNKLTSHGF